ncbi:MAG TPA: threonylcarbamoyl-AMP synthase [Aquifex aeolicus]|uniref:L-threonylcarbamoyladenylate synthase n=1 Tax=Aquifex aeolicus TaxID=63363 RepID=A0A7C5L4M6_AQUAO|nr:threonylcarbamoyl-AMP synthase [Aquifex aeolicus]
MPEPDSRVVAQDNPLSLIRATEVLRKGGLVVAPTDTIYGILADATLPEAVDRLYRIRRPSRRPFIVLLPDPLWAGKLGLAVDCRVLRLLSVPGLSVVVPKLSSLFGYLGAETVAVRYPRRGFVMRLLKELGRPVVAPSANREGEPPVRSAREALMIFGSRVDLYVEGDAPAGKASAVVDARGRVYRSGGYTPKSLRRLLEVSGRIPCPERVPLRHPLSPCKLPRGRGS